MQLLATLQVMKQVWVQTIQGACRAWMGMPRSRWWRASQIPCGTLRIPRRSSRWLQPSWSLLCREPMHSHGIRQGAWLNSGLEPF